MKAMSAPRLFIVRHGETEWSLSRRHTGSSDIGLTTNGETQARDLAPWLAAITFSRVLSSPRQRARRTCDLAGLGPGTEIEPDLAEWNYGLYDGRSSTEIREIVPGWLLFRDGCPDGESPVQVEARADRLIARLGGMTGNVALFSHAQFSAVLAARWIGLSVAHAAHFILQTASVSLLSVNPDHPETRVVALWNAMPGARESQA